jgi:hypothetical protein
MAKKKLETIKTNPMNSETLKKWAEDVMNHIFTESQNNLVKAVPWGDREHPSTRKPTTISDTGFLLQSGVPPHYVDGGKKIVLSYDAPHAQWVEYGCPPHAIPPGTVTKWVKRKLGISGKKMEQVATAIEFKIRAHGEDPHPFLRPAISSAISKYDLKIKPPI